MSLNDQVALVTGAGSGMGRAIAIQYAQQGAMVACADINGETAQATSAAIEEAGGRSLALQRNVGDLTEIDLMVQETVDTFGRLDIMVNNAGVTQYLFVMDITEADWDRIHTRGRGATDEPFPSERTKANTPLDEVRWGGEHL